MGILEHKGEIAQIIIAAIFYVAAIIINSVNPGGIMDTFWIALLIFLVPYLIAGYSTIIEAVQGLIHGNLLDENFLMSVASIAALCIGEFPEAVAVMLFYCVGEFFEDYAVDRSRRSISDMMDIQAEIAYVERDGVIEEVAPEEVAVGETIHVYPGERVPVDGVVIEGSGQVDASALTGESTPVFLEVGDDILSGSINTSTLLHVRTTALYEDSTVAKILDMVENARSRKAKVENFITRFAHIYTPVVVIAAVLVAIVPPLFLGIGNGAVWSEWIYRACIFLVISCPCALVISVPLAFFAGIGACASKGIMAKGGNYLESLARLDTVVYDKTGTLTEGEFRVTQIDPVAGVSEDEVLECAAIAEQTSNHPIALSVLEAYGKTPTVHPDSVESSAGGGLAVDCKRGRILVGNERLMEQEEVAVPKTTAAQGTDFYVALDGKLLGSITLADAVKEQTPEALEGLKGLGVRRNIMLTGDKEEVAAQVAGQVGIDEYFAQLLPQDKVAHVEELLAGQQSGQALAAVGDGINDAPLLTRADVGIAMGALGSDAAIEAADIVLMEDNPARIVDAVKISRRVVRISRQNIVFALAIKAIVLVLGIIGIANMWMAVFADVGVAILAILNSLRVLRTK